MLRLFLAIELPSECQNELISIKNNADRSISGIKWVPARNLHITLKFLGSCEDDLPEKIVSRLSGELKKKEPFDVTLGDLGGFPSNKRARVFWMGLSEGQEQMKSLASVVEETLDGLGFKKEKRAFHPHITLARLKHPQDLGIIIENQCLEAFSGRRIRVGRVTLFRSNLTPSGAIYKFVNAVSIGLE